MYKIFISLVFLLFSFPSFADITAGITIDDFKKTTWIGHTDTIRNVVFTIENNFKWRTTFVDQMGFKHSFSGDTIELEYLKSVPVPLRPLVLVPYNGDQLMVDYVVETDKDGVITLRSDELVLEKQTGKPFQIAFSEFQSKNEKERLSDFEVISSQVDLKVGHLSRPIASVIERDIIEGIPLNYLSLYGLDAKLKAAKKELTKTFLQKELQKEIDAFSVSLDIRLFIRVSDTARMVHTIVKIEQRGDNWFYKDPRFGAMNVSEEPIPVLETSKKK